MIILGYFWVSSEEIEEGRVFLEDDPNYKNDCQNDQQPYFKRIATLLWIIIGRNRSGLPLHLCLVGTVFKLPPFLATLFKSFAFLVPTMATVISQCHTFRLLMRLNSNLIKIILSVFLNGVLLSFPLYSTLTAIYP